MMINKDDYDCFDGYVDALEDAVKEYDQALERLPNQPAHPLIGIVGGRNQNRTSKDQGE
jgi:hypothetical protein